MSNTSTADQLFQLLSRGHRRTLSHVLSLVESTLASDVELTRQLIVTIADRQPFHNRQTMRIAISGAPGVGKSSLLEKLGLHYIGKGNRVAVLTVDPSSKKTGGSILGDKVRMPKLGVHPNAFVRSSPSKLAVGGTTNSMRNSIAVCEAAGFDIVFVETVGVGQTETAAADITDLFIVLSLPNAGDDIQGIKRGIMEVADIVAITKSDIDEAAASRSASLFTSALHLLQPWKTNWKPVVVQTSAVRDNGLEQLTSAIDRFFQQERCNIIEENRKRQHVLWFDDLIHTALTNIFLSSAQATEHLEQARNQVLRGLVHPMKASDQYVTSFEYTIRFKQS